MKVFVLIAAFPLYFLAEVNHGAESMAEKKAAVKEVAMSTGKGVLVVTLNMPPAPESFVQD